MHDPVGNVVDGLLNSGSAFPLDVRNSRRENCQTAKRLSDSTLSPSSLLHPTTLLRPSKYSVLLTAFFQSTTINPHQRHIYAPQVCRYHSIRSTRSLHCTGTPEYLQNFLPRQYAAADNNTIWNWLAIQRRWPHGPRVSRYVPFSPIYVRQHDAELQARMRVKMLGQFQIRQHLW